MTMALGAVAGEAGAATTAASAGAGAAGAGGRAAAAGAGTKASSATKASGGGGKASSSGGGGTKASSGGKAGGGGSAKSGGKAGGGGGAVFDLPGLGGLGKAARRRAVGMGPLVAEFVICILILALTPLGRTDDDGEMQPRQWMLAGTAMCGVFALLGLLAAVGPRARRTAIAIGALITLVLVVDQRRIFSRLVTVLRNPRDELSDRTEGTPPPDLQEPTTPPPVAGPVVPRRRGGPVGVRPV